MHTKITCKLTYFFIQIFCFFYKLCINLEVKLALFSFNELQEDETYDIKERVMVVDKKMMHREMKFALARLQLAKYQPRFLTSHLTGKSMYFVCQLMH